MSRTPLVSVLRKALRRASNRVDVDVEGRRAVLKGIVATGVAAGIPSIFSGCAAPFAVDDNVAIVGAGIAGLNAAWLLKRQGVNVHVYEGSKRVGGRMLSAKNLIAPGAVTELGGEYIDSIHADMLHLVKHFNLELLDLEKEPFVSRSEVFWFGGVRYAESDVVKAITPYIPQFERDIALLPPDMGELQGSSAEALDMMSISDYFDRCDIQGWLREFLECAFVTENGIECSKQSALNFVTLISTDLSDNQFNQFGSSDERYKVKGGNQQVTDALARDVKGHITFEHMLKQIDQNGDGFTLTFNNHGETVVRHAQYVVLAIPYTTLRNVALNIPLSADRRSMIANQSYGMNMKVIVGYDRPFWHDTNDNGFIYGDKPMQLVWDNTALQNSQGAGLTFFSGGDNCVAYSKEVANKACDDMHAQVQHVWPSGRSAIVTRKTTQNWPNEPLIRASYSGYTVGQWTKFFGKETKPEGKLYFAGEHCSAEFKGYMNGGAETGRIAAEHILAAIQQPA